MDTEELLSRFAVALGIGLLIGLERGWRTREEQPGSRTAGIRTFAISGLLGGVVGALALAAGGATSAGGGVVIGHWACRLCGRRSPCSAWRKTAPTRTSRRPRRSPPSLTFALGAYALVGDMRVAAAAAVATAALLALRENLHGWVQVADLAGAALRARSCWR